jgi:hypothetical protein
MGFFDKIKSAVNVVTGGAAEVNLSFGEVKFGEPISIHVRALAKSDLKIEKVYLQLRGVEEINVDDVDYEDRDGDGDKERTHENVRKQHETYEMEQVISGAQELENGQEYEWTTEIQLPDHLQSPYRGRYCTHSYKIFVGLDAFGNDPDSGWVNIPF